MIRILMIGVMLAGCQSSDDTIESEEAYAVDEIVVSGARMERQKMLGAPSPALAMMPAPGYQADIGPITEQYEETDPNPVKVVSKEPVSTISTQ